MNLDKQKQVFGKIAKGYQKYRRFYNPNLYKLLSAVIRKRYKSRDLSILDLGCGTGKSTIPLLKVDNRAQITGCDPDEKMLNEARLYAEKFKLPISYVQGKAEKLPFKKNIFDIITVGTAFHWFATTKALKEMQRVLKKNGLIFTYWTMDKKTTKKTLGVELYKKYGWKSVPKHLRDPEYIKDLFVKNKLSGVKHETISYVGKYSLEEYIGGLKTSSMYVLMSPSQKKGFVRGMTAAFKRDIRGKYYKIPRIIHVCYGFKK